MEKITANADSEWQGCQPAVKSAANFKSGLIKISAAEFLAVFSKNGRKGA
jgi:hypothetical protein